MIFDKQMLKLLEEAWIPLAVYTFVNQRVKTVLVSDGYCALFQADRETVIKLMDNDMYRYTHPDDLARAQEAALRFARGEAPFDVIYRSRSVIDGKYHLIHSVGEKLKIDDGQDYAMVWYLEEGIVEDEEFGIGFSLRKAIDAKLAESTMFRENNFDAKTGLPNMGYFLQLAEAGKTVILQEGNTPAMLFFDFTGMKFFNQKYGLVEGDKLLCAFADILRNHFPSENCGRLDRDHFAVYIENDHLEETLQEIFEEMKHANDGKTLPLRVGIYISDEPEKAEENPSLAIDCAKLACDESKSALQSQFHYYDDKLKAQFAKKSYVINHFDQALEEGWIRPYYQLIVRTLTGEACDAETLARWIDPERGMISPADFIEVLEDARLIHRMDLYIVECAMKDINRFLNQGFGAIPLSINLSRYDFELCDIVAEIIKRVDEAGVPHELVKLEITESVTGIDEDYIKKQIHRFHEAGFEVWMDDFGAGYSSLHVLSSFNFELIKFDMSFMRHFDDGEQNRVILSSLMQMASQLNMDTVVEGVETIEQVRFLREIGCDKIQGWYYSKPRPYEEWVEAFKKGEALPLENPEAAPYIETISKANLKSLFTDEMSNFESHPAVSNMINRLPIGIIEYNNGHFHVMRYNHAYLNFLIRTRYIDDDVIHDMQAMLEIQSRPGSMFENAVLDAIDTAGWVEIKDSVEAGIHATAYVRKLMTNPVTNASAVLVIIMTVKE